MGLLYYLALYMHCRPMIVENIDVSVLHIVSIP